VYGVAGHKGQPEKVRASGRPGRGRRLQGARGRGTAEGDKPPVLGMIQRTGEGVIHRLDKVRQATFEPILRTVIRPGTRVYTDAYDIDCRLPTGGYGHRTVCHSRGE